MTYFSLRDTLYRDSRLRFAPTGQDCASVPNKNPVPRLPTPLRSAGTRLRKCPQQKSCTVIVFRLRSNLYPRHSLHSHGVMLKKNCIRPPSPKLWRLKDGKKRTIPFFELRCFSEGVPCTVILQLAELKYHPEYSGLPGCCVG